MTLGEMLGGGAFIVSCGSLLMTYLRTARMQGADRQRITSLEKAQATHATLEAVGAVVSRVSELEGNFKQVTAALTKVAVIETKLDGFDRLVTRDMDEIKNTLRKLEERSFDPSTPSGRRRAAAG